MTYKEIATRLKTTRSIVGNYIAKFKLKNRNKKPRKYKIGQVLGIWELTEYAGDGKWRAISHCCKNIKDIHPTDAKNSVGIGCYACSHKKLVADEDCVPSWYWSRKVTHSKLRATPKLAISYEYANELFREQLGICPRTNQTLTFSTQAKSGVTTASLDRIDSSLGYVEGNVQWVHVEWNLMKRHWPEDRVSRVCLWHAAAMGWLPAAKTLTAKERKPRILRAESYSPSLFDDATAA